MTGNTIYRAIGRALQRVGVAVLLFTASEVAAAPGEVVPARVVRGRVVMEPPAIAFRRYEHPIDGVLAGDSWPPRTNITAGPVCDRGRDGLVVATPDGSIDRYCMSDDGATVQRRGWGRIPESLKAQDIAAVRLDATGSSGIAVLYEREFTILAPLYYPPNLIPSVSFPPTAPPLASPLPGRQLVSLVQLLKPEGSGSEVTFVPVTRGKLPYPNASKIYALDLEGDGISDVVGVSFSADRTEYSILRRQAPDYQFTQLTSGAFDSRLTVAGSAPFDSVRGDRFYFLMREAGFLGTTVFSSGVVFSPTDPVLMRWALFPFSSGWHEALSGDFNGDGSGDVLVRGSEVSGWWIALGNRATFAIERSVRGPWSVEEEAAFSFAGDFDGNGMTEIIRPSGDGRALVRFEAEQPTPLAEVEVTVQDAPITHTDAEGRFAIPCAAGRPCELHYRKAGYRFLAPDPVNGESVRDLVVLAQQEEVLKRQSTKPNRLGIDADGPYACLAFTPGYERRWGLVGDRSCPEDYAYMAADDGAGTRGNSERLWTNALCCRLPRGVLTRERMEVPFECPDGWVGSGGRNSSDDQDSLKPLICTKINTDRFRLGPNVPGSYWGAGQSMRGQDRVRSLSEIPIAIREAIQRRTFHEFDLDGCVGDPPGSLLINKGRGVCRTFSFRQILYRGVPGDPPDGTPVQLLPHCSALENGYDPGSGCRE